MEKKGIGTLLIKIGYILYACSICLYLTFLQLPGPISPFIFMVVIIGIMGIICTVIGAFLGKRDLGMWLVILGLIQIFTGVLLAAICAMFDYKLIFLQEFILPLGFIGIVFIIAGGLTPEKKNKLT